MSILDELIKLKQSNMYPAHMPGHKRNPINDAFPYGFDITEIDGFDDLHHATGILKRAMDDAASLYSAKKAYYLVNGSTCGILAAISGTVSKGGNVLCARNCHKAVYHALALRDAKVTYLNPGVNSLGICGRIEPAMVEKAFEDNFFDAVIITSPTYEGIVSDIAAISEIVHARKIPLIVDAAHGAHFGFDPIFPDNVTGFADIVITSLHKTLPAPTQTALLLLNGEFVNSSRVEYFLDVYETSSPSYVLMAAMEQALIYAKEQKQAWRDYAKNLDDFYEAVKDCKNPFVLRTDDPGKIIVCGEGIGSALRDRFEIEVEMESEAYAVLMTSVMDSAEGFHRIKTAILTLNDENQKHSQIKIEVKQIQEAKVYPSSAVTMGTALEMEMVSMPFEEANGKLAGEFVYVYPPGIPVLVPGEEITNDHINYLYQVKEKGLAIKGNAIPGQVLVIR